MAGDSKPVRRAGNGTFVPGCGFRVYFVGCLDRIGRQTDVGTVGSQSRSGKARERMQPERRRGLRVPFNAEAEVSLEGGEQKVPARVTEIGPQGCYLQMGKPFDAGSAIFVKFFAAATFFETRGTVAYSKANSGMGVFFRDMKPYFVDVLRKWLLEAMLSKKPRD